MTAFTFDLTKNFIDPVVGGATKFLDGLPILVFSLAAGTLAITLFIKFLRFILSFIIVQIGLREVLVSVTQIVLWVILIMAGLKVYFPDIVVFFTGSIAALGLALAAGGSTLISDIVAGLFLARDDDFNVGDEIIAGETPTQGVIAGMDARRVRLRDSDGVLHVIPNSVVERKEWVLVQRRGEASALAKAAQNLREVAAKRKAAAAKRKVRLRTKDS